jgi:hypothetical protein
MGHFQLLGVQFPLDHPSDAIQRSKHTVCYRGVILYGTVFPVESVHLEEHASRWAARAPSQMRP